MKQEVVSEATRRSIVWNSFFEQNMPNTMEDVSQDVIDDCVTVGLCMAAPYFKADPCIVVRDGE